MKKIISLLLILVVIMSLFSGCEKEEPKETIVLNVFNWGEYISDGDGSWEYEDENGEIIEIPYLNINDEFEKYYNELHPGVNLEVNYTTYTSNEDLYAKMTTSDASYDIIIPSDYLINKLIKENPLYGNVICRCETITEAEIMQAIHRPVGAKSVDGIKRRVRAGMGRCQGGFCGPKVIEILSRELGVKASEINKNNPGSYMVTGTTR